MKNSLLLFTLILLINNNLLAQDISTTSVDKSKRTCYTYTGCEGGYTISCTSYGEGCSYKQKYNKFVECTGYNSHSP